jgi:hypothetical protein
LKIGLSFFNIFFGALCYLKLLLAQKISTAIIFNVKIKHTALTTDANISNLTPTYLNILLFTS